MQGRFSSKAERIIRKIQQKQGEQVFVSSTKSERCVRT
jgi:hypothetical protein